jgi:hypothetical protein
VLSGYSAQRTGNGTSQGAQRKVPRILLANSEEWAQAMAGVQLIWPNHHESAVFDLNYGGLIVSSQGYLERLKLHQSFEFKLKIRGLEDVVPLKARLIQIQPQTLGFIFESISTDNRLMIEQSVKDSLVAESLKELSQKSLPPHIRGDIWLHGPFDTNLIFSLGETSREIEKALIEYDNLIWRFEKGDVLLQKSVATADESQGYYSSAQVFTKGAISSRVSMGASWMGRLLKCLEKAESFKSVSNSHFTLAPLVQLLQSQIKRQQGPQLKGVRTH